MRPDHIITTAEVDNWLADSAVKRVTHHRTSPSAARDIVEHGVDLDRSQTGSFGQGFYTSTLADEFYGEAQVVVAVRPGATPLGV